MRLMPTAEVGFLGMVRNEETLEASTYAERLPADLSGRQCYVLDPMLATGGTLAAAIQFLTDRGADHITCICLLVAPEGVQNLEEGLAGLDVPVTVVTAALDERLNEKGYIVPGLGDAGRPALRPGPVAQSASAGRAVGSEREVPLARQAHRDGRAVLVRRRDRDPCRRAGRRSPGRWSGRARCPGSPARSRYEDRKNRVNSLACSSSGMPMPVSLITISRVVASGRAAAARPRHRRG